MSAWQWLLRASLWIASAGLMVASSGLDGAYLAKLMPDGAAWLGFVLNTVADIVSELVMYWYGRLQMDGSSAKRKRSKYLLVGQVVLVGYAWLFSWRQLLPILRRVDAEAAQWLAPVSAAFIPVALVVVGYAQALLAGKIESAKGTAKAPAEPVAAPIEQAITPIVPTLAPGERRERVLELWRAEPLLTQAQVADRVGAKRATIGNDYRALARVGKVSRNGHGVEVLSV